MNYELEKYMPIRLSGPHSILYDNKRRDYRDKNKKENVWRSVANILDAEVEQVKARWTYLRQRYSKEKSQMGSSGSEGGVEPWYLLVHLRFLDAVVRTRKSSSNVSESSVEIPDLYHETEMERDTYVWDSISVVVEPPPTPMRDPEESQPSTSAGPSKDSSGTESPAPPCSSKSTPRGTRKRKPTSLEADVQSTLATIGSALASPAPAPNMYMNFGNFVGSALVAMPPEVAMEKMVEIMKILAEK